ncbi:pyruvate synthase subunit PorB [Dehalogenimonas alkenigignens]|uniref:Pyruvate ferredoxin oxidoreductase, beta subunit n=1 Tax=Dehalogenimonas alkenigignens TaxID=1217799 RepID=A0A0W0GJ05_9CHLR|nr:pyruvate synthase subunit PorB [Dehalogenimonas alkenigignens]KTB48504.1 pyruvate ferredoxin oxidoreductase, beta subunit [Dehalogenimonas alkenigignens]PVV85048.1 pyruvate synthase subunit beta [Dehalogenimonas alkenigignens]
MQNLGIYASRLVTKEENFVPGHRACIGCGEALAVRLAAKAFGKNTIVVNATGCMEIVASQLPYTSWKLPWIHTLFENSAAVASGVEAGLKAQMRKGKLPQEDIKVTAIAGDGATLDIGLQALSGAMERGHDFVYLCFDNEAYMNTGIQRSSATPFGASTTTSPAGRAKAGQMSWKKDMPAIAVAHNIPYVATACPSYPFDLIEKVKKGLETRGPAYIHILSVCPTGWRCDTEISVMLGRLAVETGVFPLYEVENGKYKMSMVPEKLKPVKDYMKLQRRFRHLKPEAIDSIQARVVEEYEKLLEKAE